MCLSFQNKVVENVATIKAIKLKIVLLIKLPQYASTSLSSLFLLCTFQFVSFFSQFSQFFKPDHKFVQSTLPPLSNNIATKESKFSCPSFKRLFSQVVSQTVWLQHCII